MSIRGYPHAGLQACPVAVFLLQSMSSSLPPVEFKVIQLIVFGCTEESTGLSHKDLMQLSSDCAPVPLEMFEGTQIAMQGNRFKSNPYSSGGKMESRQYSYGNRGIYATPYLNCL